MSLVKTKVMRGADAVDFWVNMDTVASLESHLMVDQDCQGTKIVYAAGSSCLIEYALDPPQHFLTNIGEDCRHRNIYGYHDWKQCDLGPGGKSMGYRCACCALWSEDTSEPSRASAR